MGMGWYLGILAVTLLIVVALWFWLLRKRPMDMLAWMGRRSLAAAGLKKRVRSTPAGPQTFFVGGKGPVLMFLHGAGDQAGTWAATAKALVSEYTLIIPDLAGHGESEPVEGPIEASQIYHALESLLEQEGAGRPVTLVGNSLGAWMATLLAQRHPEWVARVVPVNGGPLLGTSTKVKLLPTNREEAREALAGLRDPSSPKLPGYVLDDIVRRAKTSPMARFAATAMTMGPWLLTEDHLRGIQVPMRLVWGVADQLMPLEYAQRMLSALPDARLISVEHCGHVPQQEAPERFLVALRKALEG